ncbi:MAG: TRAP transporter substrate-binding protein DctP [Desulfovermiculus sp.]
MRKCRIILICIVCLGFVLLQSQFAWSGDKKVYELTFAWNDTWGPKFRASQVYRPGGVLERMLYERSDGRIKLNIVSRMFEATEILKAVGRGKADMGDVPMPFHSGTYPLWNWGDIPGIVNPDPVIGLEEELAAYEDPEVQDIYDETMKEFNLKFWFVTQWDPANGIWSKEKIESLEDLEGMKIRASGHMGNLGLEALGASPVTIAGSELAPAMMSGTVDGVLTSLGYGYSIGLADVSDYFTLTPLSPTWSAVTVINKKTFDSLPKDLQSIVMDVGKEVQRMVRLSTTAEYVMSLDTVELSGVEREKLPDDVYEEALDSAQVVREEWLEETGKQGQELLQEIEDAINNYRNMKEKLQ